MRYLFCYHGWIFVLLFSCLHVEAYIPPSEYFLRRWVNLHPKMQTLTLESQVMPYNSSSQLSPEMFYETAFFHFEKGIFQSEARDSLGERLYFFEKKIFDLPPAMLLLLGNSFSEIMNHLKVHGIPIRSSEELLLLRTEAERMNSEETFLRRSQQGIFWVIGQSSSQEFQPQLWFEKDTFFPIRLIYHNPQQEVWDFNFDYADNQQPIFFPKKIQLIQKNPIFLSVFKNLKWNHHFNFNVDEKIRNPELSQSFLSKDWVRVYYESLR